MALVLEQQTRTLTREHEQRERAEAALRWYGEKAEAFARLMDKPSALVAVYVEMALDNGERASAALRDPAPAEEDPGLLKLAAQCAPAEERRGYAPTDAIGDARAEAAEPRCVRCGSRYSPGGACSRRAEGCQGGRGEWTTFFPPAEEPKP